jgi:hypothetical protein
MNFIFSVPSHVNPGDVKAFVAVVITILIFELFCFVLFDNALTDLNRCLLD